MFLGCVGVASVTLIYLYHISMSLSAEAYARIRHLIVSVELPPGAVIREDELRERLRLGRTPIREALQALVRDQFVTVIPRRGMFVSSIDVGELGLLYETRAILEPYVTRLACARGSERHWVEMRDELAVAHAAGGPAAALMEHDRRCHEIVWDAAGNRFLTDTLDMLYAQSDRLWHMYLADVDDMAQAVDEHEHILAALQARDADGAAALVEAHIRAFDEQIRAAVRRRLDSPLAG